MKSLINFFSEKGTNNSSSSVWKRSKSQPRYFCPMKCEGDKNYDAPGNCPECNMKLVSANDIKESIVRFRCNV